VTKQITISNHEIENFHIFLILTFFNENGLCFLFEEKKENSTIFHFLLFKGI